MVKEGKSDNNPDKNSQNSNQGHDETQVLEKGDIFFFYRPKVGSEKVEDITDIRRFFMLTVPSTSEDKDGKNKDKEKRDKIFYRLFVIGKKSLPEIRETEARRSERYWAKVGGIFTSPQELSKELLSDEFRQGDMARPVGEGKYAIVKHRDHAELAYILELPKEPGKAQEELGIEKEASYIVSVINPKIPVPKDFPSVEQPPQYPKYIMDEFNDSENFVSLARNPKLIDYPNAQVILIGAKEGKDMIKKEMGIDIEEESEDIQSADIFEKLKLEKEKIPIKPITEGIFE